MQLTHFSDYALRTLIYLGTNRDRMVSVAEMAREYGVSYHHLVKVASLLVELDLVESLRGRGGGLRLAKEPQAINVGWLVRRTEPHFHIVECFDRETNTCPLIRRCKLRRVLYDAQEKFLETLDEYTLGDFVDGQVGVVWGQAADRASPSARLRR